MVKKIKKFESIENYHLTNRGKVFVVLNDIERSQENGLRNFPDLYPEVEIDGKIYNTKGINSFACLNCSKDIKIGILVE